LSGSLDRQVVRRRASDRWAGVEHEYAVHGPDGQVDFRSLIAQIGEGVPGLDPGDPSARRLSSGSVLAADGREAEVATAPVVVRPGFSHELVERDAEGLRTLRSAVGPPYTLAGFSTHLNVEVRDAHSVRTARRFVASHAVPMMLLLDRADSPGLLVRPRRGRLELGGDFVDGDRLRAAAVFAAASALALRRTPPRSLCLQGKREAARERYGFYVDRRAYGNDLYATGRDTRVGDRTAQQQLERVWEWTRPAAVGHASAEELALVSDVVAGRLPLPLEAGGAPRAGEPGAVTAGPHAFGEAVPERRRPGLTVTARMVTWHFVVLDVTGDAGERLHVGVPGARLEAFLLQLDSGALDVSLRDLLGRVPALPVLASSEQTRSVGVFRSLGDVRNLLPGERDPISGIVGGAGGPGSREHKHDSQTPDHGSFPSGALKSRRLLAMAGASAAVVVVVGVTAAVVAATGSDDPGPGPSAAGPAGAGGSDPSADGASPTGAETTAPQVTESETSAVEASTPFSGTYVGRLDAKGFPGIDGIDFTVACTDVCTVASDRLNRPAVKASGTPAGALTGTFPGKGTVCDFSGGFKAPIDFSFSFVGKTRLIGDLFSLSPAIKTTECPGGGTTSFTGFPRGTTFDGRLTKGNGPS
jgi:hypothetical protein